MVFFCVFLRFYFVISFEKCIFATGKYIEKCIFEDHKSFEKCSLYAVQEDYIVYRRVHAISNPRFPLSESLQKNLLKLYLNDVGLLTGLLYHNNIRPVLDDVRSINLGSVYESVVAQELRAHGHKLFYYDNRKQGEVDYLIDDYTAMNVHPIEVKSGKDYTVHSALNNLLKNNTVQGR